MNKDYSVVVIGASSGGIHALAEIAEALDPKFPIPIVIVQHIGYQPDDFMGSYLNEHSQLYFKEATEHELILPGRGYVSPSDYHLLIEEDLTLSLSSTERVNYARPSIDVLFKSAAYSLGARVIGVLLTGANNDGSKGLRTIKEYGGLTIVQDPETAEIDTMPRSAIELFDVDYVIPLEDIAAFLNGFLL